MSDEYDPYACIHELFERQVAATPSQTALSFQGHRVDYAVLNARANGLAAQLRTYGVGPESLVGLCLDMSIDAIVAVIAILKTGAAYVPLAPRDPLRRLAEIVVDTRLSVVVTCNGLRHRIPDSEVDVVSVDAAAPAIGVADCQNTSTTVPPDSLAYVTYTSGSTGRPKGVLATHRSVIHGLRQPPFDVKADDELCALNSPLAYGFSVSRLFLPLLTGKTLLLIPDGDAAEPERLVAAFDTHGVTSAALVTPVFRQVLRSAALTFRLQRLRTLTIGGSAVTRDLLEDFSRRLPGVTLINGYGASEIGGAALLSVIPAGGGFVGTVEGSPFPDTEVHILDENMDRAAVGSIGEIYVGAEHLARGYLGQPALTAEKFLPNPFVASTVGARMYRTGDLGRAFSDGKVEVLGRVDEQVKIRAFRVELSEVEGMLLTHPSVVEAAVVAHASDDDVRLTGYAVVHSQLPVSVTLLRDFLSDRLPQHMVPAEFVLLNDPLPRTATGKVDRKSLSPSQPPGGDAAKAESEAPRTPIEAAVASIWSETLGIESIGLRDDFLALGGHSLLAAQIIARVRETFGVEISQRSFIEGPTIERLAEKICRDRFTGNKPEGECPGSAPHMAGILG